MPASGIRVARVVAADVRIGDELHLERGDWARVVGCSVDGAEVLIVCDEPPGASPHTYGRNQPVIVRWAIPGTTVAMARDLRR